MRTELRCKLSITIVTWWRPIQIGHMIRRSYRVSTEKPWCYIRLAQIQALNYISSHWNQEMKTSRPVRLVALHFCHYFMYQSINTVANGHMMIVLVNLSFLITVYLSSWHALHFFHFTHLLQKQWNVIGFSCCTWLIFSALVTVQSHLCVPFVYMCIS